MSTTTDLTKSADVERDSLIGWVDPRNKPLRHRLGLLGLVLLAALPAVLTPLQALTVAGAYFLAMFAMSWDAVSGYTGQISLGHGLFFTAGGYTSTLLNLEFGLDPLLSIPIGVGVAVLAGLLIGVPTLRLQGPYFALVTLIAPLILFRIFVVYSDTFGGAVGLSRPDSLFGLHASDAVAVYYLTFGLFVVILGVLLGVTRSDAGAVFTAIRASEDAVNSAGLNPAKFKIFAFALSAAVGGLAGAVFVHTPVGSPTPGSLLTLFVSIEVIIAAIIGGMGTIVGAAIGGLFFVLAQEFISGIGLTIPLLGVSIVEIDSIVFALLAIALIYYYPGGIFRGAISEGRKLIGRFEREPESDRGQVDSAVDNAREAFEGNDDEH